MNGKERLMAAARSLFVHASYSEVSIGQILSAAKVQAPTLYHHFGDKEGLYVAWAEESLRGLDGDVAKRRAGEGTVYELTAYCRAILSSGLNVHRVLHDAQRMARAASGEAILNAYGEHLFQPLCAALMEGIRMEEVLAQPVDRLAQFFIAVATSGAHPHATDPDEAASWLVERFLHGVSA